MWEYWRHKLSKESKSDLSSASPRAGAVAQIASPHGGGADGQEEEAHFMPPPMASDISTSHVYFKDLKLLAHDDDSEDEHGEQEHGEPGGGAYTMPRHGGGHYLTYASSSGHATVKEGGTSAQQAAATRGHHGAPAAAGEAQANSLKPERQHMKMRKRVDRQKLIVILMGLPARGKTFLSNKLMCYLNWLGHPTAHFNVGKYRRNQGDVHAGADFFDPNNPEGQEARQRALLAALDDMEAWLATDESQVAIFDATNSTEERRTFLRERFHGKWQYLFIESICNDTSVLEHNYKLKMQYSPDYKGVDTEVALADFRARIAKYELVYVSIMDRTLHYIKLIDMVTGRGYMDVNRISGYIPGKLVFFLMQICKAGLARPRKIWLTRHGQSQYNVLGKLGGNSGLSPRGEAYAQLLPEILMDRRPKTADGKPFPVSVWTSTLSRTIITAAGLPFPKVQWKVLDEIQAGLCDGMTYEEIAEKMPQEYELRKRDKLRYRYPFGESYMDVIQRLEPVVTEMERERECVCIVAHQAVLRALYGYFMNRPLESVPSIDIPLHTLMELTPKADGTMAETRFYVDVDRVMDSSLLSPGGSDAGLADAASPRSSSSSSSSLGLDSDGEGGGADAAAHEAQEQLRRLSFHGSHRVRRSLSVAELRKAELVKQIEEVPLGGAFDSTTDFLTSLKLQQQQQQEQQQAGGAAGGAPAPTAAQRLGAGAGARDGSPPEHGLFSFM